MRHLLLAALLVAMTGCGPDTKPEEQPTTPAETAAQKEQSAALATTTTLKGPTNDVWSVSFSPDGKRIASGSWDNTIQSPLEKWIHSRGRSRIDAGERLRSRFAGVNLLAARANSLHESTDRS